MVQVTWAKTDTENKSKASVTELSITLEAVKWDQAGEYYCNFLIKESA